MEDISIYMAAGYSILAINTLDEGATIDYIRSNSGNNKVYTCNDTSNELFKNKSITESLKEMPRSTPKDALVVMCDVDFEDPAISHRYFIDIYHAFRTDDRILVVVGNISSVPDSLRQYITIIDFPLPNIEELGKIWDDLNTKTAKSLKDKNIEFGDDIDYQASNAGLGLTKIEAEDIFSKSIVKTVREGSDVVRNISNEKAAHISSNNCLQFIDADLGIDDIGGLSNLKKWLESRSCAYTKEAHDFGLPMPKGIMIAGMPGCGKSLTAKVCASIFNMPLLRFDVNSMLRKYVGESERELNNVFKIVNSVNRCVLFMDEADKMFGGMSEDSSVTHRMFGNILTWMQDRENEAFIIMTSNNIAKLQKFAPELLRKGRLDEVFFVDLPSRSDVSDIFRIMFDKYDLTCDFNIESLCSKMASKKCSGSDVEQVVISAKFDMFTGDKDLERCLERHADKVKNSVSDEKLEELRDWSKNYAINAS